jgi:hypothetical protein
VDHQGAWETLLDIERRVEVNDWAMAGVCIWPLLRTDLWIKLLAAGAFRYEPDGVTVPNAPAPGTMPREDTTLWSRLCGRTEALFEAPAGLKRADVMLWSRAQDHGEQFADGRLDRIIDPLLEDVHELGMRPLKLSRSDIAGGWTLRQLHPSVLVELDKLHPCSDEFRVQGDATPLLEYLAAVLPGVSFEGGYLRSRVYRLLSRAAVFVAILTRVRPRVVFTGVFYAQEAAALALACRRSGIPLVDVQHGKQGLYHALYGGWSRLPRKGYEVLPDWCWTWGQDAAERIDSTSHRPSRSLRTVVGGHRWLGRWLAGNQPAPTTDISALQAQRAQAERIFVISLQPLAELIPAFVLASMQAAPAGWHWRVRLHPHSRQHTRALEQQLLDLDITTAEVGRSSTQPLYAVLDGADGHITCWSTVAYEALAFGIPTVLVHATGRKLYATDIANGLFDVATDADSLNSWLAQAHCRPVPPQLERYIATAPATSRTALRRVTRKSSLLAKLLERDKLANLLLLLVSLLLCGLVFLGVAEAYARYFFREMAPISWRDESIRRRALGEDVLPWMNPLRQGGPSTWTGTIPGEMIVSGGETGEYTLWRADSNGFKNPAGLWEETTMFDVVSVGDSFSLSRSLPLSESWHRLLETRHGLASYSIAMGGTGSFTAFVNVHRFLPQRRVGSLVYGFYANDFADTERESGNTQLQALVQLARHGSAIPVPSDEAFAAWKASIVAGLANVPPTDSSSGWKLPLLLERIFQTSGQTVDAARPYLPPTPVQLQVFRDNLAGMARVAAAQGAGFVVLHFPAPADFLDPERTRPRDRAALLRRLCDGVGCTVVDFHSLFESASDTPLETFFIDVAASGRFGHFNATGAAFVASEIARHLDAASSATAR